MMQQGNENICPKVLKLLLRHMAALQQEKLDGIRLLVNPDDPLEIQALVDGPTQTPYEGGTYRVRICIGADFPTQPPKAVFLTKVFHPNISAVGEVCVNTLKRDWDPQAWSIGHILQVIRCLLIVPFPESALNEEAGRLFMESYDEYATHAAMINRVHAIGQIPGTRNGIVVPAGSETQEGDNLAQGTVKADDEARRKALKQAQKSKKSLRRL